MPATRVNLILAFILSAALISAAGAAPPQFILPKTSLSPADLAVIVNDGDPLSREIAAYYQSRRGIPDANMIHVRFTPGRTSITRDEFARIKAEVDRQTPPSIQAYALTWAAPYRVDCMSITSAFAFGYDEAYCAHGCRATKMNPYYNSASLAPYRDFKMRPAMALAGLNFQNVKELIDRGVAADDTRPPGTGYLVSTNDKERNVRAAVFPKIVAAARDWVRLRSVNANYIQDKKDVLFYFTGLAQVPGLDSLRFVPGAMADHLTSTGGQLTDSGQMSSLRWLESGATGSYGTVVEPCNFPGKFPNPALAIAWYLQGASLIEAYWKSVAWPGQGIFIGEPLAAPFGGYSADIAGGEVILRTRALPPGAYALLGADSPVGPYRAELNPIIVRPGMKEFRLGKLDKSIYRLMRVR
jgi:uncharacterized protein (TIGR03790 family)